MDNTVYAENKGLGGETLTWRQVRDFLNQLPDDDARLSQDAVAYDSDLDTNRGITSLNTSEEQTYVCDKGTLYAGLT